MLTRMMIVAAVMAAATRAELPQDYLITTVAGNGSFGYSGDRGRAIYAQLNTPFGVAMDSRGVLYIADTGNGVIRKVTPDGRIRFFANVNATDLAVDSAGNLYASVFERNHVVKITPGGTAEIYAGDPTRFDFGGDGGPATQAGINGPRGLAVDAHGNLYIASLFDNRVRKVTPDGFISTVAGRGDRGSIDDGGPATQASLNRPIGLTVDSLGNLYIGDYFNARIRKVGADGMIHTIAGDDPATAVQADSIAVGPDGSVLFTEGFRHRLMGLLPDGTLRVIAGDGTPGYTGDGGPAKRARFNTPVGLATDGTGSLWVADVYNNAVRKLEPASIFPTLVTNAASLRAGPIAKREIVLISGDDLGPTTGVSADDTANPPTELGGTRVLFNEMAARLFYADAHQVRAVVPDLDPQSGTVSVRVQKTGDSTNLISIPIADFAPGIFTADGSGTGPAAAAAAARGQSLILRATGVRAGAPLTVLIDNLVAEVRSVRERNGPPGITEIEAVVPARSRTGQVNVAVIVDGYRSQPFVTVAIQ